MNQTAIEPKVDIDAPFLSLTDLLADLNLVEVKMPEPKQGQLLLKQEPRKAVADDQP